MILEVTDIHSYYELSHILFGVSLKVNEAETVCLLGRNGAGKTTTMRSIMGLTPPKSGSVKFMGKEIISTPPHLISRMGIGIVLEERKIYPDLTVYENLQVPFRRGKNGITVEFVYDLFPVLRSFHNHPGGNLSGGEQQMLAIGRTLLTNPILLLMDEPAEGLSPIMVSVLGEGIQKLREQKISILLSEQNVKFAVVLSERAYIIEKGTVRYDGSIEDIKENEEIKRKYLMV